MNLSRYRCNSLQGLLLYRQFRVCHFEVFTKPKKAALPLDYVTPVRMESLFCVAYLQFVFSDL